MFEDYYAILGVTRTANPEEIKRAYRRLAIESHPDRNPDSPEALERFKACVEAYAVLGHSEKRRHYDKMGHVAFTTQDGLPRIDFKDIFESIRDVFLASHRAKKMPADLNVSLEVSFEEAALGAEKLLQVDRKVPCRDCGGTGAERGTVATTCIPCKGRGELKTGKGLFVQMRDCPSCEGTGKIITSPCPRCLGTRFIQQTEALMIQVPAGIEDNKTTTLRGSGDCTLLHAGDLHVSIHIKKHPLFRREGADIHSTVYVTYPQAVLGDEIEAPTVSGPVLLKLPAATRSGKVFRLRGKGFPILGTYRKGDQYVHIELDVPSKITARQRELLLELRMVLPLPSPSKPRP